VAAIAIPVPAAPRELTPARRALKRLARRRGAMVGLGFVVFFVLLALFAPWVAPHDPLATNWSAVRQAHRTLTAAKRALRRSPAWRTDAPRRRPRR